MRILFVHHCADLYGASRCLARLADRLVQDGHSALVVLPFAGPLAARLQHCGVQVRIHRELAFVSRNDLERWSRKAILTYRIAISTAQLVREIRSFRPDLVHTNTSVILSSAIAAKLTGVPHVWHVREFVSEFPRLWHWHQRYMLAFSKKVFCVSQAVANQFSAPDGKAIVIHDGFPAAEFEAVSDERVRAFRNAFGLTSCQLVAVIGRINNKRKGQDVFVRAAAILKDRFPTARFLLIGSPFPGNEDHLVRVQELIRQLNVGNQVIYTGDIEDIKAAIAALDIVVLPSSQPDAFSGVIVEGMALGKPVVGAAIGGTVEQVEHGQTGLLVPPGDPVQLAAAIGRLLSDPHLCSQMGRVGRERFLSRFELEPIYSLSLSVYEALIKSPSKALLTAARTARQANGSDPYQI